MVFCDEKKIRALAQAAQFDLSCSCGSENGRKQGNNNQWVYPASLPNGRTIPILKVLQFGGCERNCLYCAQRLGGVSQSYNLSADELADTFHELNREGRVGGLFLSSAVQNGAVRTMDRILDTASILRKKKKFRGYLHLKIIPGAEEEQIIEAMRLATRVSINLEAPSERDLLRIASSKKLTKSLFATMEIISRNLRRHDLRCKSQTTQFVVGASDERDDQILQVLSKCYKERRLARGYFSAFQPIQGTPLEYRKPAMPIREHRLYQADYLIREYGFDFEELIFDATGNLSLKYDPKRIWVDQHPELFPMEINKASKKILTRVPGVGPRAADNIVALRLREKIQSLDALKRTTKRWRIAAPYLLLNGRRFCEIKFEQLDLW